MDSEPFRKDGRVMRKTLTAVGLAVVATVGGALVAAPASAHPTCPAGFHCVFRDNLGDNQRFNYFNSDDNFTNERFSDGGVSVNDRVSAASNSSTGGFESHYYLHANRGVFLFCVNPGSATGNFGSGDFRNDNASSLQLRPTTAIPCF
jgi:hypothetical protein